MELHTYNDGSKLIRTTAQHLISIPIWKGNRILDIAHKNSILAKITDVRNLDSGYTCVVIHEEDSSGNVLQQRYIIDGQHRKRVLEEMLFAEDFEVTITEKHVSCETELVEYFNKINNSKPIHYDDPVLVANSVIVQLEKVFGKNIRQSRTVRPYISVDKLREKILTRKVEHGCVARIVDWNTQKLRELEVWLAFNTADTGKLRALDCKFMLGIDDGWVMLLGGIKNIS